MEVETEAGTVAADQLGGLPVCITTIGAAGVATDEEIEATQRVTEPQLILPASGLARPVQLAGSVSAVQVVPSGEEINCGPPLPDWPMATHNEVAGHETLATLAKSMPLGTVSLVQLVPLVELKMTVPLASVPRTTHSTGDADGAHETLLGWKSTTVDGIASDDQTGEVPLPGPSSMVAYPLVLNPIATQVLGVAHAMVLSEPEEPRSVVPPFSPAAPPICVSELAASNAGASAADPTGVSASEVVEAAAVPGPASATTPEVATPTPTMAATVAVNNRRRA